jgi:hypothetical protein
MSPFYSFYSSSTDYKVHGTRSEDDYVQVWHNNVRIYNYHKVTPDFYGLTPDPTDPTTMLCTETAADVGFKDAYGTVGHAAPFAHPSHGPPGPNGPTEQLFTFLTNLPDDTPQNTANLEEDDEDGNQEPGNQEPGNQEPGPANQE